MAIYTKKGDRGKTSVLESKERIPKDSLKINAIGAVDELNSYLGVVLTVCQNPAITTTIKQIQNDLFRIGSILAGSRLDFSQSKTKSLEKSIDHLEGKLPVLKNFLYSRGSSLSSHLQYSRTLARKAERQVVALNEGGFYIRPSILSYLNRLSDALFMLAREANYNLGIKEEIWKAKK